MSTEDDVAPASYYERTPPGDPDSVKLLLEVKICDDGKPLFSMGYDSDMDEKWRQFDIDSSALVALIRMEELRVLQRQANAMESIAYELEKLNDGGAYK